MKTFTKFCVVVVMALLSSVIIAQQAPVKQTGQTAPDKFEMIQTLHGPTLKIDKQMEGMSKAIGDDCAEPIIISALPYSDPSQTTTGRGNTYDETCLNDFDGGEDIIYELEITSETTIIVEMDPKGTQYTGIALSDACPLESICLAISYDLYGAGTAHGFTITLDAGFYYIMIDTWPGGKGPTSIPDFDLAITTGTLVINDDCADAIDIGEVNDLFYSTTNATDDGPLTCVDGANIWYNYTASFTGFAVISLCGSFYDTQLAVYTGDGCPVDPADMIACNDDFCGYEYLQSQVIVWVEQGKMSYVYKIEIGGFSGDTGDGYLSIYEFVPCTVTCTPSSLPEGEPCGDDINGGCNMATPAYTTVNNGETICGNLWSEWGTRDTDWFEIELDKPSNLKMNVIAEGYTVFGLVQQVEMGVPGCDNLTGFLAPFRENNPCVEDSIWMLELPEGTYYLFVAPVDFFGIGCPGYTYMASFEVEELPTGFISGKVYDQATVLGIQGVTITAGDYSTFTQANGVYILELLLGTYDVEANGYDVGYETKTVSNIDVLENQTTTVDFVLEQLPAPVLLSAVPGTETVTLTWAEISDNSDALAGDIASNNNYIPSTTMDLDFTLTIFSWDFEWGTYCEMVFPAGLTPNSATDLNGVAATIVGQTVSWMGLFYSAYVPEEYDFAVNVTIDAVSGPQDIDYLIEGDGYGGDPHSINGHVTVYEYGGTYVPTFNIYRQKGREYILVANDIQGNTYVDGIIPGGDEWCYYVTQILNDQTESPTSNILCATPFILPGSTCDSAFDYGQVNDPAMNGTLIRDTDARWYKFDVPYTMDVVISLCNSDFDTKLALYDDCANFNGNLPVNPANLEGAIAFNDDSQNWCGSNRSQINYQYLPAGTYYAAVYGANGEFGDFEISVTQVQILMIRNGWSGLSIYMIPTDPDIEVTLANIADSLIIAISMNPYGIWWPPENVNTIGTIGTDYGYKSKMQSNSLFKRTALIYGTEDPNKTVNLPAGVSYLSVKSTVVVDANLIATALGANLKLLFDIKTLELIWPAGGLYTLDWLVTGHGYLINMNAADTYTYPLPTLSPGPIFPNEDPLRGYNTPWNDVSQTGITHFISITEEAQDVLKAGDLIGVFNESGLCVGITEFTGEDGNLFLPANGNDAYTDYIDGLNENETMTFKLFRTFENKEYKLEATFSTQMPNYDGMFKTNGMSMITNLKVGATSINENELSSINLFPNPSNGIFNISGLESNVKMIVTNAQGQEISHEIISGNTQLDLSSQPKGIYFIKFINEESLRIDMVVVK